MCEVFTVIVGTRGERDSFHPTDRRPCGGAVVQDMVGPAVVRPDFEILRQDVTWRHLLNAVMYALQKTDVFPAQGKKIEPVFVGDRSEQRANPKAILRDRDRRKVARQKVLANEFG